MNEDFYGLPTQSISNQHVRLDFLTTAGPRIVRLFVAGSSENLLAELPHLTTDTVNGRYHFRGGHRLWHAPEAFNRTYIPDDAGLIVTALPDGVRLDQPTEGPTGIAKRISLHLDSQRPVVTLHHQLCNHGLWPVVLAPWAISQLRLGGTAVLPQQTTPLDPDGLLSNRNLILWPYSRWQDPRLQLHDDLILIDATQPYPGACKIGQFNRHGWLGYFWQDLFFCKRFSVIEQRPLADDGCNAEIYINSDFIELESLAPLTHLDPGQCISHTETWELYTGVTPPQSASDIRQSLAKLIAD